jgi:hypothetical protein
MVNLSSRLNPLGEIYNANDRVGLTDTAPKVFRQSLMKLSDVWRPGRIRGDFAHFVLAGSCGYSGSVCA